MSGLAHLHSLAQGERPADDGLLGNTRYSWGGRELPSEEAILASFAANPFALDGDLHEVETAQGAALISADGALFADLYDGRIGRLWRVGGSPDQLLEPSIDVAFDPDMRQELGGLSFRADDHPCLHTSASEQLLGSAERLIETLRRQRMLRARGFVTRAFGDANASAALVALYTMSDEASRATSFRFAAIAGGAGAQAIQPVIDAVGERAWTPRL